MTGLSLGFVAMTNEPATEALLITAEVAVRLDVSQTYMAMLCDAGQLGEVLTAGGRRRVRPSAVDAYLASHAPENEGSLSPREAGIAAGLYSHSDDHFKNEIR